MKQAGGGNFDLMNRAIGLIYFRARWYDPNTGRWLSKDPMGNRGRKRKLVPLTFLRELRNHPFI